MAQPSTKILIKDAVGSVAGYALVNVAERIVKPNPESFMDEVALAAIPLATALFMPPKWNRQGAALGGAAMYPLLVRLATQAGIV